MPALDDAKWFYFASLHEQLLVKNALVSKSIFLEISFKAFTAYVHKSDSIWKKTLTPSKVLQQAYEKEYTNFNISGDIGQELNIYKQN